MIRQSAELRDAAAFVRSGPDELDVGTSLAQFGDGVIPTGWLNKLELRDEITQVANDIYEVTSGVASIGADLTKYPPN